MLLSPPPASFMRHVRTRTSETKASRQGLRDFTDLLCESMLPHLGADRDFVDFPKLSYRVSVLTEMCNSSSVLNENTLPCLAANGK